MTSPADPQVTREPSARRREEVKALWQHHRSGNMAWLDAESFWSFIAALDARSAERTRAEVEKMREAAAKVCDDEDQELAYGGQHDLWRAAQRALKEAAALIRVLPIEGTSP